MKKCNQMIFDISANDNVFELAQQFLTSLLKHNINSTYDYNDIHIYHEETLIIVEWTQIFYSDSFPQDHFELVDFEHVVVKELILPDNSITYVAEGENDADILKDWCEKNPDYPL